MAPHSSDPAAGTAALGNYDMIGRRLFMSVSKKW